VQATPVKQVALIIGLILLALLSFAYSLRVGSVGTSWHDLVLITWGNGDELLTRVIL